MQGSNQQKFSLGFGFLESSQNSNEDNDHAHMGEKDDEKVCKQLDLNSSDDEVIELADLESVDSGSDSRVDSNSSPMKDKI